MKKTMRLIIISFLSSLFIFALSHFVNEEEITTTSGEYAFVPAVKLPPTPPPDSNHQ